MILERIVVSTKEPLNKNVLWIDGTDIKYWGPNGWSGLDVTENDQLWTSIQEEIKDREDADIAITEKLDKEIQDRIDAITTVTEALNKEVSDRQSSDTAIQTDLDNFKNTKGEASGLAPLNESGKVDSQYLPSFVDDVIEVYATYDKDEAGDLSNIQLYADPEHQTPITGESGKIYVNITPDEPNYNFRWSGTQFSPIDTGGLILGEITGTAYDGGKGKHTTDVVNSIPSGMVSDLNRTPGRDSVDIGVVKYIRGGDGTFTQDIPRTVNIPAATLSTAGVMTAADKQKLDGLKEAAELDTELQEITDKIGSNTYTDANYISKETNLTDAALQLDEEIKATNDNLALMEANLEANYLPLSGGTLTGPINITYEGIKTSKGTNRLLFYNDTEFWVGAPAFRTVLETSDNDILHRKNDTNYIVYDESNFVAGINYLAPNGVTIADINNLGNNWSSVLANTVQSKNFTVNGATRSVLAPSTETFSIYAPTTSGTSGQVLVSNGEGQAPSWTDMNVDLGDLSSTHYIQNATSIREALIALDAKIYELFQAQTLNQ